MASYNPSNHNSSAPAAADVLSSSLAAGGSNTQHSYHSQHQHHNTAPPTHQFSSHLSPPPSHNHHNPQHQQFERSSSTSSTSTTSTTTFLVPVTSSHLPLDSSAFLPAASPHFVTSTPVSLSSHSASNTSSSSYTFVQIKREPCQVSEVTTSNTNNHHHTIGSIAAASSSLSSLSSSAAAGSLAAAAKTMSSSTLTTLVKIEASSPKVHEMDKSHVNTQPGGGGGCGGGNLVNSSNNTVPIGIAVARKRPQETTAPPPPVPPSLTSSSALPLSQPLNKDMNCFGIRVADLGGVGTGCGNIYFTGNGDLMTNSATADELALANAASLQSVNRAPSTFWQYSNALPIESVISMSPATVGLQYSREASRGQVVLLPATATPLGLSNYPILYTPTDPFQQAAAAAFVWPSYIPQGTAPATLQPPPNFIFPSMSPHSTLQAAAAAQPYATSLQLLGSNYLTAAAAAAAAAAATSTLCQHNQQTNSTSSSINLSLGASVSGSSSGTTMSSSSSSTTTRYMSLATTGAAGGGGNLNDTGQSKTSNQSKALGSASVVPPTLALAPGQSLITPAHQHGSAMPLGPPPPLLIPPTALKMEEWSSTDFMTAASKTTTTTLTAAALSVPQPPPPPAHFDHREKNGTTLATTGHSTTNLLELSTPTTQALNLMRLPTPPTSATIESAAVAAAVSASGTPSQLSTQLLFQTATPSPTPTLLNLSATLNRVTSANTVHQQNSSGTTTLTPLGGGNTTPLTTTTANGFLNCPSTGGTTLTASIGPPTPLGDDIAGLHFKTQHMDAASSPQIVVGVPRIVNPALPNNMPSSQASAPQMQDVNIQTDTPVCSEDENSSCPLNSSQCNGANISTNSTEQCTTAQCTPPLTQNDELYHDTEAQQPLELTKPTPTSHQNRSETPQVESSSQLPLEEAIVNKSPIKQQPLCAVNDTFRTEKASEETNQVNVASTTPAISSSTTNPEDMTGLELLSNISTSSLAKTATIRVKQEPPDTLNDLNMCHLNANSDQHIGMELNSSHLDSSHLNDQQNSLILRAENLPTPPSPAPSTATQQPILSPQSPPANITQSEVVEPLGGLKLLCALAEQRIQEEEEVQSTTMNASGTSSLFRPLPANSPHNFNSTFGQNAFVKSCCPTSSVLTITFPPETQNSSFPSLETLELPSTSTSFSAHIAESSVVVETPVKRKKHKHSKSSKSSTSANGTNCGSSSGSSKKSQKCSKKNKKKYSKEKKRHKLLAESQQAELDFDDPQLQQELQNAFQNCVDPSFQRMGKWPTPQEIFSIMENSMRMRLADITRQYRKKKRKLDEISKNKKKKKCSKLQASQQQQISLVGNSALSLAASEMSASSSAIVAPTALSSSPLCDYKFGKFSTKSSSTTTTTNYLAPSSFIRFATTDTTKSQNHHHHHHHTHPQFPPPPDIDMEIENATNTPTSNNMTPIYKPVRLEPSSLDQRPVITVHNGSGGSVCGSNGVLRLAQKHASSDKHSHVIVCKEPRLSITSSRRSSGAEENEVEETNNDVHVDEGEINEEKHLNRSSSDAEMSKQICVAKPHKMNPIDRSLMLTQDHLYRHETRVLTDMGGLFYAGIMKPLQPPDVYAITLDGERGNKSHIMSREEIFKDTILELAPKTVEDVPVGTRLCAYWSQQYRCLYPGRAIESESSDDDVTAQEFVSVEFDDGDSGRIRLQNIRFLLSDYPQVGKHKKSSSAHKVSTNNESDHHHHSHGDEEADDGDTKPSRLKTNGSSKEYHQATAMEIFAAKRSEKKRNKSLKKKSQAQSNINANNSTTTAVNGTTGAAASSGVNGTMESADCSRKHHKHKKRKKHKKHRKNLMEIGIVSEVDKTTYTVAPSSYIKKADRTSSTVSTIEQQHNHNIHHATTSEQQDAEEEMETEEVAEEEENYNTQTEDSQMAEDNLENINLSRIKQESNGHIAAGLCSTVNSSAAAVNIKVKTEQLDMEEESTSNLMSEISDEAKGEDTVEHNSSKGSKIAAFLPERQLWGWLGTAYCKFGNKGSKGRIRKQFYKTIKRGKETITVGDCAVFLSTGRPDRPYIGRIESMWENSVNNKIVRVRWFYHPEETIGCPNLKYPGALFESPHEDENDVQTISHRCEVLEFNRYYNKFGSDSKQYQSIYDNNDTYYLAGYYNPRSQSIKLENDIPILEEQIQLQQQQKQLLNTTIILKNNNNATATVTATTINNKHKHTNLNNNNNNNNNNDNSTNNTNVNTAIKN
ncbi:hypothetical protein DOY81_007230 [Sarcophaga bullata]|nr:hypothetical protein DOY81_007230 [Sarcophaga bullata]